MALGILMARCNVTSDEAWAWLPKESQNINVKLSVPAEHVLETEAPLSRHGQEAD